MRVVEVGDQPCARTQTERAYDGRSFFFQEVLPVHVQSDWKAQPVDAALHQHPRLGLVKNAGDLNDRMREQHSPLLACAGTAAGGFETRPYKSSASATTADTAARRGIRIDRTAP